MRLVKLTYFNGQYDHEAEMMINPDYVVFLVEAQSGKYGAQTWLRLTIGKIQELSFTDILVRGSMEEVAAKLAFSDDPVPKRQGDGIDGVSPW